MRSSVSWWINTYYDNGNAGTPKKEIIVLIFIIFKFLDNLRLEVPSGQIRSARECIIG